MGATLVPFFLGLDVLAIIVAFAVSFASARRIERVVVTESRVRLIEVRVDTWGSFVWYTMDNETPPLLKHPTVQAAPPRDDPRHRADCHPGEGRGRAASRAPRRDGRSCQRQSGRA